MDDSTLLSIKQFAKFAGTTVATLRHYDAIGLLPASVRGEENNYRFYRPDQRKTLNFIHLLVDLGIPLSEVQSLARERTPENLIHLLAQQEIDLDYRLYELQTAYSIIHTFRRNIQNGLMGKAGKIELEILEDVHFILGPVNEFDDENDALNDPYIRFCNAAKEYRINLRYPIGCYFYDMDAFLSDPYRPAKYYSLDPIGNCTREAGRYLVGYHQGSLNDLGDLPQKLDSYAEEAGLMLEGPVYLLPLLDEISIQEPSRYLSRIAVGVVGMKEARKCHFSQNPDNCPQKETCVRPHCIAR